MDDMQFILLIEIILSIGLLIVTFFRPNVLFTLAGIMINVGITQTPGVNKWIIYGAILLAAGEAFALVGRIAAGGKKNKKTRYTG